jgi:hypothetical protein
MKMMKMISEKGRMERDGEEKNKLEREGEKKKRRKRREPNNNFKMLDHRTIEKS